ncbi:MAG TPA: Cof-type HAD-IIB family hydrolase [Sphingomonas sp.]|nr:Cof-type HAD-IIB family hydrolase [Sphingomonas sp.]
MIRLVVSDVDGTLVDKQKQLTPGTIAAVKRLEAAEVGFTIISARPMSGLMPIADALGLDVPLAAFNGGIVFHRDGRVESHVTIERDVAEAVLAAAAGVAVDIWVFADDQWYATSDHGTHVEHERVASNQAPFVTTDFAAVIDRIDKITFVSDDEPVLRDLHARIDGMSDRATIAQSQTYYLDVTALAANKGDGIAALAAAFDVPMTDIAAIGDQANDVPMLERAGVAIAMGNAPDRVKSAAHHVTTGNDVDGVAHAIDTLILTSTGAAA